MAAAWLNAQLKITNNNDNSFNELSDHLHACLQSMQLEQDTCATRLEHETQALTRHIPRTIHSLQHFKSTSTDHLHRRITQLQSRVTDTLNTTSSVDNQEFIKLSKLDSVRDRMESALNALQDIDKWNALEPEMEQMFSSGSYAEVLILIVIF